MEAKRPSSTNLPDELVAKIIAMMPFPSIFKARLLSRTWLARLSPIKSPFDEQQKKHRATRSQARKSVVGAAAFQKQLLERSANWPVFFPFKLGTSDSWAYELSNHSWRSLPSLSFLPECVRRDIHEITTAGGLSLIYTFSRFKGRRNLCIANIFTRSSKVLPPRPEPEIYTANLGLRHAHIVTDPSMQAYKVIIFCEQYIGGSGSQYIVQTYNSRLNAWSSKTFGPSTYFGRFTVHLNGVLYWTEGNIEDRKKLIALDCEMGTLTELSLSGSINELIDGRILSSKELVVCNSSLVMVVYVMIDSVRTRKLVKIDLGSGRLSEIGIGGPALKYDKHRSYNSQAPFGHGDCIYFGFVESYGGAVTYNLPKDEWSCLDVSPNLSISNEFWDWTWKPSIFEPGLNLLMPV